MLDQLLANWHLKLLAVLLAFGVWVSVTGEAAIFQDFAAPLDLALPADRILTTDPPKTITVRLRGSETSIRRLDALRLSVSVDLRDGSVGDRDVSIDRTNLAGVPRGVQVDFMDPDRLRLQIDRRVQRILPVEPTFLGKPPDGYAFYGAETQPGQLRVDGPESELESLEVLRTNPIRLDEFTRPGLRRVATVPDRPHVRVVDADRLTVRVVVDLTPVERTFEHVPVRPFGASWNVETTPTEVTVTLAGPPDQLDQIRPELLVAQADVSGLEPRNDTYPVELEVRYNDTAIEDQDRISLKSMSRSRVRVRVSDGSATP